MTHDFDYNYNFLKGVLIVLSYNYQLPNVWFISVYDDLFYYQYDKIDDTMRVNSN